MTPTQRRLEGLETAIKLKCCQGLLLLWVASHDVLFVKVDEAVVEGTVVCW